MTLATLALVGVSAVLWQLPVQIGWLRATLMSIGAIALPFVVYFSIRSALACSRLSQRNLQMPDIRAAVVSVHLLWLVGIVAVFGAVFVAIGWVLTA